MPKTTSNPNDSQTRATQNLSVMLREMELIINLSPKLSKAQIQKLKLLFNQIVKEKA